MLDSTPFYVLLGGIVSHLALFIHGEYHLYSILIFKLGLVSFVLLYVFIVNISFAEPLKAAIASLCILFWYSVGVFASMTTYRLFFHRLTGIPGPTGAKISKLWHVWHVLDGKQYLLLDELYRRYGDIVRTGKSTVNQFRLWFNKPIKVPTKFACFVQKP